MNDIRLLTGKNIIPDFDTAAGLLGCRGVESKSGIKAVYETLFPLVKRYMHPKAAFLIDGQNRYLYVMLTLGSGISRLPQRSDIRNDMLKVMMADAMADSCIFAFEEQILPMLSQSCLLEGFGILRRCEIPSEEFEITKQKEIYDKLDAKRTLGLTMTSGYMLEPVKSMCLLFELTEDTDRQNFKHDCNICNNQSCTLRKEEYVRLEITTAEQAEPQRICAKKGENLLAVLREHGMEVSAYCGGSGICGKCAVTVTKGDPVVTPADRTFFSKEQLAAGKRLACQVILQEDLDIYLGNTKEQFQALGSMRIQLRLDENTSYQAEDYGVAVDIGTTTLAFALLKRQTGEVIDVYTMVNHQRSYGADVISRIQAANGQDGKKLTTCILTDIKNGFHILQERNPQKKISSVVIAGNTVMMHLLRGYSCQGFTKYPFTGISLDMEELSFAKLLSQADDIKAEAVKSDIEDISVTILPGISAFVGADITAGIFACDMIKEGQISLLLDLGTNGEMALRTNTGIYVTSTAAGPAFEGGNIRCGMGSVDGAIANAKFVDGRLTVHTIGEKTPVGICGTGVIETVAELLQAGIIDANGKLIEPYFKTGYPLAENAQGEKICLTQADIREIQMAKAAVRAGIEVLCMRAGVTYQQIEQVYLAGGFGYYLDVKKAAVIGILPQELAEKTTAAGNTALGGALQYLETPDKKALMEVVAEAGEVSLAEDEAFKERYISYMGF